MLIGICGAKRSGKTTLGNALSDALDMPHTSFAEPMRSFVAAILGIDLDELERVKDEPVEWLDGVTPRHMLETVGTEWGRNMIHPDLWIRSAKHRVGNNGIISDVRFPNEADAVRDIGFLFRVSREGEQEHGGHESNRRLPDNLIDHEIRNSGTVDCLSLQAIGFLRQNGVA